MAADPGRNRLETALIHDRLPRVLSPSQPSEPDLGEWLGPECAIRSHKEAEELAEATSALVRKARTTGGGGRALPHLLPRCAASLYN